MLLGRGSRGGLCIRAPIVPVSRHAPGVNDRPSQLLYVCSMQYGQPVGSFIDAGSQPS